MSFSKFARNLWPDQQNRLGVKLDIHACYIPLRADVEKQNCGVRRGWTEACVMITFELTSGVLAASVGGAALFDHSRLASVSAIKMFSVLSRLRVMSSRSWRIRSLVGGMNLPSSSPGWALDSCQFCCRPDQAPYRYFTQPAHLALLDT